jgi:selenocysteine lyase/cysteine desulfurase
MGEIMSSGEENASGVAALGKALVLLQRIGMEVIRKEEQELTRRMLNGLAQIPGLRIYGVTDPGSPGFAGRLGVFVFRMKGKFPDRIAKHLAGHGIGMRYGCHCSHILVKHLLGVGPKLQRFQHILLTLFPMIRLPGLARISLGIENTEKDIDTFLSVLNEIT